MVLLYSDLWSGPQPAILVTCIPRGRFGYIMVPGMHYSRLWTPLHDGRVKKKHVLRSMIYMILHSFDRQQWTYTSTCNSLTPVYTWTWIMSWCVDGIWYIYHSSSVGKWFIPGTWCHTLNYVSTRPSFARRETGVANHWLTRLSGLCVLNLLLRRYSYCRAACLLMYCMLLVLCCWPTAAADNTVVLVLHFFTDCLLPSIIYLRRQTIMRFWEMDAIIFIDTWGRYFNFYSAVVGVVMYQNSTYPWLLLLLCCNCCWRRWWCFALVLLDTHCCSCSSCCCYVVLLICD